MPTGAGDEPPSEHVDRDRSPAKPALSGVFVRALPVYGDIGAITIGDGGRVRRHRDRHVQRVVSVLPAVVYRRERRVRAATSRSTTTGTGRPARSPPGNPTQTHDYVVYAIWRTPDGTPSAIQLQRVDGVVPSGPLFTMYRQWWTGTARLRRRPRMRRRARRGSVWRSTTKSARSSAEWARVGRSRRWYASWAQYYQGLADAAGCTATP